MNGFCFGELFHSLRAARLYFESTSLVVVGNEKSLEDWEAGVWVMQ